jgi:hypothetical protein
MMKVGNNYDNQNFNIIYGNNDSEPRNFLFENMICSNVDKKKLCKNNENHRIIDELKNKKGVHDVKTKRFRWNFDLDVNLQKIIGMYPNWMPQENVITFIHMYPNLNITLTHVK